MTSSPITNIKVNKIILILEPILNRTDNYIKWLFYTTFRDEYGLNVNTGNDVYKYENILSIDKQDSIAATYRYIGDFNPNIKYDLKIITDRLKVYIELKIGDNDGIM